MSVTSTTVLSLGQSAEESSALSTCVIFASVCGIRGEYKWKEKTLQDARFFGRISEYGAHLFRGRRIPPAERGHVHPRESGEQPPEGGCYFKDDYGCGQSACG